MAMLTSYSLLSWSPSVCLLLCIRIRSSHIFIHVGYLNISSSPFSWMAFSQFPRTRNISMSSAFMPTMGPPQVLTYCTWSSSSCAVSELAARELAVKNIPYPKIKKKKKAFKNTSRVSWICLNAKCFLQTLWRHSFSDKMGHRKRPGTVAVSSRYPLPPSNTLQWCRSTWAWGPLHQTLICQYVAEQRRDFCCFPGQAA